MTKKVALHEFFKILDKCTCKENIDKSDIIQEDRLMLRSQLIEGNKDLMKLLKCHRKITDLHQLQIQLRKMTSSLKKNSPDKRKYFIQEIEKEINKSERKSFERQKLLVLQPSKRIGYHSVSISRNLKVRYLFNHQSSNQPMTLRSLDFNRPRLSLSAGNDKLQKNNKPNDQLRDNIDLVNISSADLKKNQEKTFQLSLLQSKQISPQKEDATTQLVDSSAVFQKEIEFVESTYLNIDPFQSIDVKVSQDGIYMQNSDIDVDFYENEIVILKYNAEEIYGKPQYDRSANKCLQMQNLCIDQMCEVPQPKTPSKLTY